MFLLLEDPMHQQTITIEVYDCTFTGLTSSKAPGGAIYAYTTDSLVLHSSLFASVAAVLDGGAIYAITSYVKCFAICAYECATLASGADGSFIFLQPTCSFLFCTTKAEGDGTVLVESAQSLSSKEQNFMLCTAEKSGSAIKVSRVSGRQFQGGYIVLSRLAENSGIESTDSERWSLRYCNFYANGMLNKGGAVLPAATVGMDIEYGFFHKIVSDIRLISLTRSQLFEGSYCVFSGSLSAQGWATFGTGCVGLSVTVSYPRAVGIHGQDLCPTNSPTTSAAKPMTLHQTPTKNRSPTTTASSRFTRSSGFTKSQPFIPRRSFAVSKNTSGSLRWRPSDFCEASHLARSELLSGSERGRGTHRLAHSDTLKSSHLIDRTIPRPTDFLGQSTEARLSAELLSLADLLGSPGMVSTDSVASSVQTGATGLTRRSSAFAATGLKSSRDLRGSEAFRRTLGLDASDGAASSLSQRISEGFPESIYVCKTAFPRSNVGLQSDEWSSFAGSFGSFANAMRGSRCFMSTQVFD
jgi:hypothetical protein